MTSFFAASATVGVVISLAAYYIGMYLKKKTGLAACNPLLVSIILVILFLAVFRIDYESYNSSAKYLSYLLTPATVSLAIPLYQQLELLKKNAAAILIGVLSGVLTSLVTVLLLCMLFRLSHAEYVTLLPKSITTAIGMGVSEELGGFVTITIASIIITGVSGNIIGEGVLRLFRVTDPIAKGLAMGTSAHAIGTARAMEMGEVEGAMSSLAIVVAGLFTVLGASFFSMLY